MAAQAVPLTQWIPTTRADALDVLETTNTFADAAVALGGHRPTEFCAFIIVMRQPDAVELFRALLHHADKAGQLYALSGLYLLDHDLYLKEVVRYESDSMVVGMTSGCILGAMKASEVVHAPDEGHPDIASGGYPRRFAESKGCSQ